MNSNVDIIIGIKKRIVNHLALIWLTILFSIIIFNKLRYKYFYFCCLMRMIEKASQIKPKNMPPIISEK